MRIRLDKFSWWWIIYAILLLSNPIGWGILILLGAYSIFYYIFLNPFRVKDLISVSKRHKWEVGETLIHRQLGKGIIMQISNKGSKRILLVQFKNETTAIDADSSPIWNLKYDSDYWK